MLKMRFPPTLPNSPKGPNPFYAYNTKHTYFDEKCRSYKKNGEGLGGWGELGEVGGLTENSTKVP